MPYKNILLILVFSLAQPAFAWVHISQLKPHLAVSPNAPTVTFYWNGDAPELELKGEVLEGKYSGSSNAELMAALLEAALGKWNDVETAYVKLLVETNSSVQLDENDEVFSIVVAEQDSKTTAAAALPSFISQDPDPSANEANPHIIHDCDISVSNAKVAAKTLLHTLVHELGHCLGLGHPHSSYVSIMSYASTGNSANLALDDKAGVSFLYPEPGQSLKTRDLTTCGSLGSGQSPWVATGLGFAPLLWVLGLQKVFRGRRSNHSVAVEDRSFTTKL